MENADEYSILKKENLPLSFRFHDDNPIEEISTRKGRALCEFCLGGWKPVY
jgi:hypothetical protein